MSTKSDGVWDSNAQLATYPIGVEPNWIDSFVIALQYFIKVSILLITLVRILVMAGSNLAQIETFVSLSFLGAAIATLLHCFDRSKLGKGYTLVAGLSPIYFVPVTLAAADGGISAIVTMTLFAGVMQIILSFFIKPTQKVLFNPLIIAMLLMLSGIWLGELGIKEIFEPTTLGALLMHVSHHDVALNSILMKIIGFPPAHKEILILIGIFTLLLMLSCYLWGNQRVRSYCIIIAVVISWLLAYLFNVFPAQLQQQLKQLPLFYIPAWHWQALSFSLKNAGAFVVAALFGVMFIYSYMFLMLDAHGQADDERLQIELSKKASILSGIGVFISGVIGGFPQTPMPGTASMNYLLGVYSRRVGFICALLLLIAGLSPRVTVFFMAMPASINGAFIALLSAPLFLMGLKIMTKIRQVRFFKAFCFSFIIAVASDTLSHHGFCYKFFFYQIADPALFNGVIILVVFNIIFLLTREERTHGKT